MDILSDYYLMCSVLNQHTHIVSDFPEAERRELIGQVDIERYFRRKGKGLFVNESFIGGDEVFKFATITWKRKSPSPYF